MSDFPRQRRVRGSARASVVEAALERFLNPAPSVEDVVQERFDDMDHEVRSARARYSDDGRNGRAARTLSSLGHASDAAITAAGGGSFSATNASWFWPSRSTGVFDWAGR